MRPPQPDVAPSSADDCHTDCWSLCENSLGGKGTERARYCALVVGCTSVPTLSITTQLRFVGLAYQRGQHVAVGQVVVVVGAVQIGRLEHAGDHSSFPNVGGNFHDQRLIEENTLGSHGKCGFQKRRDQTK